MKTSARDTILRKVKEALKNKGQQSTAPDFTSEVYIAQADDIIENFAEKFINAKGVLFFCENNAEFISLLNSYITDKELKNLFVFEKNIQENLDSNKIEYKTGENTFLLADASITTCECLISRTGGMFVTSATESGRRLSVYPPIHIVVAYTSQIVKEINDGINLIKNKYEGQIPSMISMITGPSRTADIEKTLVLGAHGPKELTLFLIDDSLQH
jgi:L-lactate dehydrogenase complex protein LldG